MSFKLPAFLSENQQARELAARISLKCWQEPVYKKIYLFFIAWYLVKDYFKLDFPNAYMWAELFINYEGGFIRRGLLGQFFYYTSQVINMRFFGLLIFTIIYLLFLKLSYERISSVFDKLTTIIIFITPAYFIFFVKDYAAFLRKDLFINLLALFTVIVTVNFLKQQKIKLFIPTLVFCGCFIISFLIHEATVFYFTLPAWFLGLLWARQKSYIYIYIYIWFAIMLSLFISAGYTAIHWTGTQEEAKAIYESWLAIYPDFLGKGALSYLGMPLSDLLTETAQYQHNAITARSAIWGLFLACCPLAWICLAYRPFGAMRKTLPLPMLILLPFAAAAPWCLPVFACDFGRHIAMACTGYIIFLWGMASTVHFKCQNWLKKLLDRIDTCPRTRIIALGGVILYGTSWTLLAWAPVGHSFVILAGLPDFIAYLLG